MTLKQIFEIELLSEAILTIAELPNFVKKQLDETVAKLKTTVNESLDHLSNVTATHEINTVAADIVTIVTSSVTKIFNTVTSFLQALSVSVVSNGADALPQVTNLVRTIFKELFAQIAIDPLSSGTCFVDVTTKLEQVTAYAVRQFIRCIQRPVTDFVDQIRRVHSAINELGDEFAEEIKKCDVLGESSCLKDFPDKMKKEIDRFEKNINEVVSRLGTSGRIVNNLSICMRKLSDKTIADLRTTLDDLRKCATV